MAEDAIVVEAVTEEVIKSEDTVEESAPEVEAEVEKADEASETEAEVDEVEKSEDTSEAVEADVVEKDSTADQVDEINTLLVSSLSTLTDAVKSLNDKIEEMNKSLGGVKSDVAEVKGSAESLGKRVDAVEDTTAFRKSGDLGEVVQEQVMQKSASPWGGRFLNSADL